MGRLWSYPILLAALTASAGCFFIGGRVADTPWAEHDMLAVIGYSYPIPLVEDGSWVVPVQCIAAVDSGDAHRYVSYELGIGISHVPWRQGNWWWKRDGGVAYYGGGFSLLGTEALEGPTGGEGISAGVFMHCGVWWWRSRERRSGVYGVELRARFGSEISLLGREVETHALDIVVVMGGL